MTRIAGYIINSCPVVLGDFLVSNPKGKIESISTPTRHEAEEAQQGDVVGIVINSGTTGKIVTQFPLKRNDGLF
jgi:hypothetical protein